MRLKHFFSLCLIFFTQLSYSESSNLLQQMQALNQTPIKNDSDLWARMRAGFQLNHRETKEVKYWEKRYGSQKYFNIIMQNAAPYLYFVMTEFERRGMPTELALIPIVESTYNPNAVSPAAISTGMWQFLASSGRRFGMTINSNIDERKDIIKSSRGAIAYLDYLHDLFDSWELAIAAYNWGEGNIYNATLNAKSNNFYDLKVRDITRQYVPKIIALANLIENPKKFSLKLSNLPNQAYFSIVTPTTNISVANFNQKSDLSTADNKKLNPQYLNSSYIVSSSGHFLLPLTKQDVFLGSPLPLIAANLTTTDSSNKQSASAPINNTPISSQPTSSEPISDAITIIANQEESSQLTNKLSASTLITTNTTKPSASNTITTTKKITNQAVVDDLLANTATTTKHTTSYSTYLVTNGDTLYSIAKRFDVPIDTIRSDNQITNNDIHLAQKLRIRQSTNSPSS